MCCRTTYKRYLLYSAIVKVGHLVSAALKKCTSFSLIHLYLINKLIPTYKCTKKHCPILAIFSMEHPDNTNTSTAVSLLSF